MQTKPNITSRQGIAPSLFDFAAATDPTEHERLLMEELCQTQSALAEDDWFSRGGQGHKLERLLRRRR